MRSERSSRKHAFSNVGLPAARIEPGAFLSVLRHLSSGVAIRSVLLTAFCLIAMRTQTAEACTCGGGERAPSDAWFESSEQVFEAVVGEPHAGPIAGQEVPISVLRSWKGDIPTRLTIMGGPCAGTNPELGTRVLFYGTHISHCTVVFPSGSPEYDAHIAWLGAPSWNVNDGYVGHGCAHCAATHSSPRSLDLALGLLLLGAFRLRRKQQ